MRQSVPRLRRIRFKDGRPPIEIFNPIAEKGEDWARQVCESVLREHRASGHVFAGAAFVVWSPGLDVTSNVTMTGASSIPKSVIPEFVKCQIQQILTEDDFRRWMKL